jgi:hypothetical protein
MMRRGFVPPVVRAFDAFPRERVSDRRTRAKRRPKPRRAKSDFASNAGEASRGFSGRAYAPAWCVSAGVRRISARTSRSPHARETPPEASPRETRFHIDRWRGFPLF